MERAKSVNLQTFTKIIETSHKIQKKKHVTSQFNHKCFTFFFLDKFKIILEIRNKSRELEKIDIEKWDWHFYKYKKFLKLLLTFIANFNLGYDIVKQYFKKQIDC